MMGNKVRFTVATVAIALSTAFCAVLLSLLVSLTESGLASGDDLGRGQVEVNPTFSSTFFSVTKEEVTPLDEEAKATIAGLPGVESVSREAVVRYPASAEISFFNTTFETDTPIYGVEDRFFEGIDTTGEVVPVLISKNLIDLYNVGISKAISKPQINEEFLKGFRFDILLGYSSFFRGVERSEATRMKAEVVGVVQGIPLLGVTLPMSEVERINNTYSSEEPSYNALFLELNKDASYETLKTSIEELGFTVTSTEESMEPLRGQFYLLLFLFSVLAAIVLLLTMLLLFYVFYGEYSNKAYLLSVMSSLGAGKAMLRRFFYYQVLTMGVLGVAVGLVGASVSITSIAGLGMQVFGEQSSLLRFLPKVDLLLLLQVALFMAGIILLATLLPIRKASTVTVKEILRS